MDENAPSFSNALANTVCLNLTWRLHNSAEAGMWSMELKGNEVEERQEWMV